MGSINATGSLVNKELKKTIQKKSGRIFLYNVVIRDEEKQQTYSVTGHAVGKV